MTRRDAVKCACGWIRRIPNALPPGNGPATPAMYREAVACHGLEPGAHEMVYPEDSTDDTPMLSAEEIAVGAAYMVGHTKGFNQAWAAIERVFGRARADAGRS